MEIRGLLELQLMMFVLMGAGIAARKKDIVTKEGKKVLTDLVINIILPCNILSSFCVELNHKLLEAGAQVLLVSVILQIFCTFISALCYNHVPKGQRMILQYGTVCSNAGFLGNPVAEGLYGAVGLMYASLYLIPQRIVMWSAGVSYFTESPGRKEVIKKVIRHPCIIAVFLGFLMMAAGVKLPGFLNRSIKSLGGCTTALTMLLIGAILADSGIRHMVSKITVIFSIIRLLAIPAAVMAGCYVFHVEKTAAGVSTILAAMPAGSTTAILAAKYNGDEVFASRCVVLTTILSMILLPVWCMVLNRLF